MWIYSGCFLWFLFSCYCNSKAISGRVISLGINKVLSYLVLSYLVGVNTSFVTPFRLNRNQVHWTEIKCMAPTISLKVFSYVTMHYVSSFSYVTWHTEVIPCILTQNKPTQVLLVAKPTRTVSIMCQKVFLLTLKRSFCIRVLLYCV